MTAPKIPNPKNLLGYTGAIWRKFKLAKSKYIKKYTRYRSLVGSKV